MKTESREGDALVPSTVESIPSSDGTDEHREQVLARARATIERVEARVQPAEPQEQDEFDLQSYLAQFPRPLNGSTR